MDESSSRFSLDGVWRAGTWAADGRAQHNEKRYCTYINTVKCRRLARAACRTVANADAKYTSAPNALRQLVHKLVKRGHEPFRSGEAGLV